MIYDTQKVQNIIQSQMSFEETGKYQHEKKKFINKSIPEIKQMLEVKTKDRKQLLQQCFNK